MPNLFGIDFAKELTAQVSASGGFPTGTLTKITPGTRTPGDITGGTNPTTTTHTFNGFLESKEVRRPEQVGASVVPVISILGASVSPVAVPDVNDEVLIEGATYILVRLTERDGAAALYEFEAQEL